MTVGIKKTQVDECLAHNEINPCCSIEGAGPEATVAHISIKPHNWSELCDNTHITGRNLLSHLEMPLSIREDDNGTLEASNVKLLFASFYFHFENADFQRVCIVLLKFI